MAYLQNGENIFQLGDWVPDSRKQLHTINDHNYLLMKKKFIDTDKKFTSYASGYNYSNALSIAYKINSPNKTTLNAMGYRPSWVTLLKEYGSGITKYINWFEDGEVYISATKNSRTGDKISNARDSGVYPCGIKTLFVLLVGGGASGGSSASVYSASGGGGGASAMLCLNLLGESGYGLFATGGNVNGSSQNDGEDGIPSVVLLNTFSCTCEGGAKGKKGASGLGQNAGGKVSYLNNNWASGGYVIKEALGGNGGSPGGDGGSASISANESPEGLKSWSKTGGAGGPTNTGGGGGSSVFGRGGSGVTSRPGNTAEGYGGGGAGGGFRLGYWNSGGHGNGGYIAFYY